MLIRLPSSQQILLQWIALVVMTLDHYVMIFHDGSHWIHYLSRFVFPVFAYLVAFNYHFRTRNKAKYMGRLLIWALIAQPIYSWAFGVSFYMLNILFTLSIGLSLLYGHDYLRNRFTSQHEFIIFSYVFLILFFLVMGVFVSYHWFGIALLTSFSIYFKHPSPKSLDLAAINVVLLNVMSWDLVQCLCSLLFFVIFYASTNIAEGVTIPRLPGWVFYVYYPSHIAILGIFDYML